MALLLSPNLASFNHCRPIFCFAVVSRIVSCSTGNRILSVRMRLYEQTAPSITLVSSNPRPLHSARNAEGLAVTGQCEGLPHGYLTIPRLGHGKFQFRRRLKTKPRTETISLRGRGAKEHDPRTPSQEEKETEWNGRRSLL